MHNSEEDLQNFDSVFSLEDAKIFVCAPLKEN
jgi:hypothetical protein